MNYIKKIDKFIKKVEEKENINVLVKDLTYDTNIYNYNENDIYVSASTIKLPIMLAILDYVHKNNISLGTYIKIDKTDITEDNKCFNKGRYQYSIIELIIWMITISDNSATNVLIKYLGFENINKYFKKIRLEDTKLERYMLDEDAIKNGKNNYTSLVDMYKCFEYLVKEEILTESMCRLALSILYKQKRNNQINRYIKNVKFAHKTGSIDYLNSDVGIFSLNDKIYFIGISIYNCPRKNADRKSVGKLSKMIYKNIKENNL